MRYLIILRLVRYSKIFVILVKFVRLVRFVRLNICESYSTCEICESYFNF